MSDAAPSTEPAASEPPTADGASPQAAGAPVYEMTISLNVLNHLGLNLYSNHPAVLSEAVANAWDADASRVDITLDVTGGRVVVQDDGDGMNLVDINNRFLRVGYQRREDEGTRVTGNGRAVMGRKGIGKLSLFSIANKVMVETVKDGEKHALLMDLAKIKEKIENVDPSVTRGYQPEVLSTAAVDFAKGTRITLTELKKDINKTRGFLARRLSRRFSVLGQENGFRVFIGSEEVEAAEVNHLPLVQYLWTYGDDAGVVSAAANNATHTDARTPLIVGGMRMTGWLGTAVRSNLLKDDNGDDLNRIAVMVRGKLAQEDLLSEFNEGGVYSAYIIGELHADFLDTDDQDDIATSSRQRIREDDDRFEAVKTFVQGELRHIQRRWADLRAESGTRVALTNPAIQSWFDTLEGDVKKRAVSLFGRINQLTVDDEVQRNQLFAHGVLAFETMQHKAALDAIDSLTHTDLPALLKLFTESADLEAVLYHRIVRSRVATIEKLRDLRDEDAKERFLQEHIFKNLWLLDPGWERATDGYMEQSLGTAFALLEQKADEGEAASRMDIRYQKTSGLHVVVELKRSSVRTSTARLQEQTGRYVNAMRRALLAAGRGMEPVEAVCLVGTDLTDWGEPDGRTRSTNSLKANDIRVMRYDELLSNSIASYQQYLDKQDEVGRVQAIFDHLVDES